VAIRRVRGRIAVQMLRIFSRVLLFLALSLRLVSAVEGEAELFTQASKAFADRFYERAEQQFGDFVAKFAASTNAPNAILLQAEARFFLRRYDAAADLLEASLSKAGPLGADFIFWTGEAQSELGNYQAASQYYHKVATNFPASPLRLKASYLEAYCASQLKDYARVIELLNRADSTFQKLAKEAASDPASLRGELLAADAFITLNKIEEAKGVLGRLSPSEAQPEFFWEKEYLLARSELAATAPEAALPHLTNALAAAGAAKKPLLEAQTRNLEADVYRKLNRNADALATYEKIGSIESLPVDQKRLALLKSVELLSTTGSTSNALVRIETYLGAHTNEPAADLLNIKAGELWIDQFRQTPPEFVRQSAASNALAQARSHLKAVLTQYTNSTYLGRALLNLGWALWEEGNAFDRPARIQESESAFQNAAEKLTRSDDQALAFYKMGDAQLVLKRPESARTNYLLVVRNYTDIPQVRNALLDKAYRQLVRASLELKDFSAASTYLSDFRKDFPNNPLTEEALFHFGKALAADGQTAAARAAFEDFLRSYPSSVLAAEVRFAETRTYAAEGDLETALRKNEQWLATYTNHVLRPLVEFRRASLLDKAGLRTNALVLFTNFVNRFPTSSLAPAAQTWVGDYYYDQEQWRIAEQNYQRVFENTNWFGSPLTYQARLMAAKTAFRRQGYNDARAYLTNLINYLSLDTNAPADLAAEAYFVLGDVFLEEPIAASTNAVQNFIEAARVFDRIATQYPSNKLAVLALGKKGDCHLQLAALPAYADSYREATNAYTAVLNSRFPDMPIAARNQAEVGLGVAFKNMAEGKSAPERERLQLLALDHFLNVVHSTDAQDPDARPDPYYLKVAGLEAGRLAEVMGKNEAALRLYRRLMNEAPSLKNFWETRINSLQQRVASNSGH
jgi:TolA-binding protein